jgi:nicotinate-nucleotide adenylyltransferase
MNKIGLFGGTFNPIHYGHLRPAQEIGERLGLDSVIFIPSSDPPHKEKKEILAANLRAQMVRLAIADNPRFLFSDVEIRRPGKSYSVETISYFRRTFGGQSELYFILGLDAFLEIGTWKDPGVLFTLCHFVIMTRPGFEKKFTAEHLPVDLAPDFCYDAEKGGYLHKSGCGVFPREITALDISSTKIRESVRSGISIRYLLPRAVEQFIREQNLYGKGTGSLG